MNKEIEEEQRYFISVRKFKHFAYMRNELLKNEYISESSQAVYVTLSEKHRKIVLRTIKLPVPQSHMIGQWLKSELIELSKDSSEPYDEELVLREKAWMERIIQAYNTRR